jgi:hypothetical protein
MTGPTRKIWLKLAVMLAMGVAVAGFGASGIGKGNGMADETVALRTLCIGRYLVDVPAELELMELYGTINAVQIERLTSGEEKDLAKVFDARVAALQQGRAAFQGIPLIYKDQRTVEDVRIVAYRSDTTALGTTFEDWTEEAYVSRGGVLFRLEAVMEPANADAAQAELVKIAKAVQPRADTEVPRGIGVCVPGAFVAVPPMSEAAGATLGLVTDDGPLGLEFSFAQRMPHHLPLAVDTAFNDPRAEIIEIAGHPGQQLLLDDTYLNFGATAGQPSSADTWGYLFRVEYYDQRVERSKGPLSNAQASDVWPRVLQSIRPKG